MRIKREKSKALRRVFIFSPCFTFSQLMLAAIVLIIAIIPENWRNFRVIESSWDYNNGETRTE